MCTLHFWSPLKCSSILHFQSLQRKNPNVSFLIRWNVYKKRTFWKLISYIFKKTTVCALAFFVFVFVSIFRKTRLPVSETAATTSSQRSGAIAHTRVHISPLLPGKTAFLPLCLPHPRTEPHGPPRVVSAVPYFPPSDPTDKRREGGELPEVRACGAHNTVCWSNFPAQDCVSKGQRTTRHQCNRQMVPEQELASCLSQGESSMLPRFPFPHGHVNAEGWNPSEAFLCAQSQSNESHFPPLNRLLGGFESENTYLRSIGIKMMGDINPRC